MNSQLIIEIHDAREEWIKTNHRKPCKIKMGFNTWKTFNELMRYQHELEIFKNDEKFLDEYQEKKKQLEKALEEVQSRIEMHPKVFVELYGEQMTESQIIKALKELQPEKTKITHIYDMEIHVDDKTAELIYIE